MRIQEILLVGKMDGTNDSLAELIKNYFHVQFCTESKFQFERLMQVAKPDLILIIANEFNPDMKSVFWGLEKNYLDIPVVVIGTKNCLNQYEQHLVSDRFVIVYKPVSDIAILDACMKALGIERKNAEELFSSRKSHILVVDDNAVILRSIKSMLEEEYSVAVAASATQALTAIGKRKPDLILLDYLMPVMDGKELFKLLKGDEKLQDIPVVFLTSVADKEECLKVLSMEPAGYILKPPVKDELLYYVRKTLLS